MLRAGAFWFRGQRGLSVEGSAQDRFQALIRTGLPFEGTPTGGFQPGVGVGLGQTQNAQTGTIAHLRMRLRFQDGADDLGRGFAHTLSPVNQSGGSPLQMSLMALGP